MALLEMDSNGNVQEVLSRAEKAVATVKDPSLRPIAFGVILTHMLGERPTKKSSVEVQTPAQVTTSSLLTPTSPAGFVRKLGSSPTTDQILACIYYLAEYRAQRAATSTEIQRIAREAFVSLTKNPAQTLLNLKVRGHITETGAKRGGLMEYTITLDGVEYIEKRIKNGGESNSTR